MSTDWKNPLKFDTYSVINTKKGYICTSSRGLECIKSKKNLPNKTIFEYLVENVALAGATREFFSGVIKAVVKLGPA